MYKIKKHKDKIVLTLLVLSLSWAAISVFLLFSDYGRLHRGGFMPGPHGWRPHPHHAPTQSDIDRLQPWVTFAFINSIFNLPPDYLQSTLAITSSTYPNLTIEAAAKDKGMQSGALLVLLKNELALRILPTATTTP